MKLPYRLLSIMAIGLALFSYGGFTQPDDSNLRIDRMENELIVFERVLPRRIGSGATFTVEDKVIAKQKLELIIYSDQLPPEFKLVNGSTLAFKQGVSPDDTLTNTYTVLADSKVGNFIIRGYTRVFQVSTFSLTSIITVGPFLKILTVTTPGPMFAEIEEDFRHHLLTALLENVEFATREFDIQGLMEALQQESVDLVVLPRYLLSEPQMSEIFPLLVDLVEYHLTLIDAGLVYVPVEQTVIGVELPWDSHFVLSIASSAPFESAFTFLKALGQNVFDFGSAGIFPGRIKVVPIMNRSATPAFEIRLEFYQAPAKVTIKGDNMVDWICGTKEMRATCTSGLGLQQSQRLTVGVVFQGETWGTLKTCEWFDRSGALIGTC